MKYVLIIWVCSFIQGNACKAPMEYPTMYNSWYECSEDSISIFRQRYVSIFSNVCHILSLYMLIRKNSTILGDCQG